MHNILTYAAKINVRNGELLTYTVKNNVFINFNLIHVATVLVFPFCRHFAYRHNSTGPHADERENGEL